MTSGRSPFITDRLDSQHPKLFEEVVTDLQVLRGDALRNRVTQWKCYLAQALGTGGVAEDLSTLQKLLSFREQLRFLEQHLTINELLEVLITLDKNNPLIQHYLPAFILDYEQSQSAENLLTGACIGANYDTCLPEDMPAVISSVWDALKNLLRTSEDLQKVISLQTSSYTPERQRVQAKIARGCDLGAHLLQQMPQNHSCLQGTHLLALGYDAIHHSTHAFGTYELSFLIKHAEQQRFQGDLDEAIASSNTILFACGNKREKIYATSIEASGDLLYAKWLEYKQKSEDNFLKSHEFKSIFQILQLYLEKLQRGDYQNESSIFGGIWEDLCDMYECIQETKHINGQHTEAILAMWRFTYGWYMYLTNNPEQATKELALITSTEHTKDVYDKAQTLLKQKKISFISADCSDKQQKTIEKKPGGKIISLCAKK